jgi:Sulfotransferase family
VHYLSGHYDIAVLPREVHFFDRHLQRGIDWYRGLFTGAEGAAVGESTPEYMYDERVPPVMARIVPQARLIAILRDPVDRAYSHYWHNRTRGHEPLTFPEALEAEPARLSEADPIVAARFAYVDRGRYLLQLERLAHHYPLESMRVVLFEDLRDQRLRTVRSLYQFLEVDDRVIPPWIDAAKNRFVTFRSQRLREPIRRLPGPLRRVAGRLNLRYGTYPPLEMNLRAELENVFDRDNHALAGWLGLDLAPWRKHREHGARG